MVVSPSRVNSNSSGVKEGVLSNFVKSDALENGLFEFGYVYCFYQEFLAPSDSHQGVDGSISVFLMILEETFDFGTIGCSFRLTFVAFLWAKVFL